MAFVEGVYNKSLKPTDDACHTLCEKAKLAPRYGGLVPPLDWQLERLDDTVQALYKGR